VDDSPGHPNPEIRIAEAGENVRSGGLTTEPGADRLSTKFMF